VALAEELPPGGAPLPVRLLGEDLVLFRDDAGRVGLLGLHCAHRGADLSYGRLEDGGLRCLYHGWLYDVQGRCLEQPGEPAGSTFHQRIRHTAYPCRERAGTIFAYLGPGEPPELPGYAFLNLPDAYVLPVKLFHACNYLQANEGNLDILHVSFMHLSENDRMPSARPRDPSQLPGCGTAPHEEAIDCEPLEFGLRVCKIRYLDDERQVIRVGTFILPNLTATPAGQTNWHVPIDDTHHWKYTFIFDHDQPLDKAQLLAGRAGMTADYRSLQNAANRYGQDRAAMRVHSYTGMGTNFQVHDLWATESAGPIQDRTEEHLAVTDVPLIEARKQLKAAIQAVQAGRDPPGVVRDPARDPYAQVVTTFGIIPSALGWRGRCAELERGGRAWQSGYLAGAGV
jgi:phenylpropionate dioxygenase-like ring-hydroxylating dioxygenase large terminal subunit